MRYVPKSHFSPHVHTGGEEFFVLEGVFQDEHGDFPADSYIRNPPKSKHTPGSELGCTIFVKLWQFDLADRTHVRIDTNKLAFIPDRERASSAVWQRAMDIKRMSWKESARRCHSIGDAPFGGGDDGRA